jgi:hypothetical protein
MEEAASAQRREIENNSRQNDTNLISTDIHLDKVRKRSFFRIIFYVLLIKNDKQKKGKEINIFKSLARSGQRF